MGLEIGGFEDHPDWPKMGPSLLIATCLILAIRTAKWATRSDMTASDCDLEKEIDHAAYVDGRVFAKLVSRNPSIFPKSAGSDTEGRPDSQPLLAAVLP